MSNDQQRLTVEVGSTPDTRTIRLIGEADLIGSPLIVAAFEAADPYEVVIVDLRGLTFIDSSGLHAMVKGHDLCQARGQELRIIRGSANVQRLFELTAMTDVLPFWDGELQD